MKKKLLSVSMLWVYRCIVFAFFFASCTSGNSTREPRLKEYVFTVNLVDDETKVREYLDYHRQVWPEVEESFRKAGYEQIRIYHFARSLCMIIAVREGVDLAEAGKISAAYHKKVKAWNALMDGYQEGVPGTLAGQTWVEMEEIYVFKKD
ncbi:L-rhamnose mutarotase [Rapidithrix thailandica]|uniref:L-rhamnose mutarotase n=1 Tax=Rapidithrix thailandica TaxID=413964 RepID=A0AAW9S6J7_9BACT